MKFIQFYLLLGLTGCGSGSSETSSAPKTPETPTVAAASTDPRITQIHMLCTQLLMLQQSFLETEKQLIPLQKQVEAADNSHMLQKDKELPERKREFAELITASKNIESSINQLDPSKSQEATQVQLVSESLERSQAIVGRATDLVEKNKRWIGFFEKTAAFRNSQKSK
jgi:hypothetical protein